MNYLSACILSVLVESYDALPAYAEEHEFICGLMVEIRDAQ